MRKLTGALAAMAFLAAACGGGGGGGGGQPEGSTKVSLTEFSFSPASIQVKSGKAVFYLVNVGKSAHDMVIEKPGGGQVAKSDLIQPGDSTVLTVDNLAAGDYTFICDQPGHESAGMKGTLKAS